MGGGVRVTSSGSALVQHYLAQSRAAHTTRTYAAQWRSFQGWCAKSGQAWLPASTEAVATYLAERAQAGAAMSSIAVALAAIQFAHDQAGMPMARDGRTLRLVLDGIRRIHIKPQRQVCVALAHVIARCVVVSESGSARRPPALWAIRPFPGAGRAAVALPMLNASRPPR